MAIRVTRNDAGNCITFVGSTNPVYWNSCLSAQINEGNTNNIDVINDIRSVEEGTTVYEFFNIPYTDFQDKDGNDFDSPSACADYITVNANVVSNTGTFAFSQLDEIDAQRDATNTTVLFSNGDIYAVNSLVATAEADGTIKVSTVRGDKTIYTGIRFYNVSVNDSQVTGFNTITAAVDRLNEVLSGGAIGSDTGSSVTSTTTTPSTATFTVYGDRITETGTGATLGYTSTADTSGGVTNFDTSNGIYSNQVISEAGEYFEFSQDQGDWSNARGVYIGLFDETTYDVADLDVDSAGNAVKSMLYLRLKNTPFVFADSSDNGYGKVIESGFNNSPQTKETFRLGLDQDRRGYIAYQKTDGTYEVICRTATVVAQDTDLRMIAIMPLANELNGIRNATVNEEVLGANYTWYYIESPDGDFYYPLFSSASAANDVDEFYGTAAEGAGLSHQHTFVDELPTSQTWYMPDSYMFHAQSSAPTPPAGITYNEVSTGVDSDYAPSQFSQSVTVDEGDNINLQIVPTGDAATYSLTNIPAGLAFNSTDGLLQGTAPDVAQDNVTNPSDTYTITVTKANEYGSSVGTLTLTITNLTAPAIAISGFTHISASTALVDSNTLDDGSGVTVDDTVQDGYRFKMTGVYVTTNILPALQAASDKVFVGFAADLSSGWDDVSSTEFSCGFRFQYHSSTVVKVTRLVAGNPAVNVYHTITPSGIGHDFYLSNKNGILEASYHVSTQNKDSEPTVTDGGSFGYNSIYNTNVVGTKTIAISVRETQVDISTSGLSEHQLPTPSNIITNWTKALDFSGGNEHAYQVGSGWYASPMKMGNLGATVTANTDAGKTSNDSSARPWATAVVFKSDGNNSNQHIWNAGEGASTGDDNIYVRQSSAGDVFFGWGREGTGYNECKIGTGFNTSGQQWFGLYIAHKGQRFNASDATAANLAAAFDIRFMQHNYTTNQWETITGGMGDSVGNRSTTNNWSAGSTGYRMDRQFAGTLTLGGRSSNRNWHGKIASMVVTGLRVDVDMPDTTEIELMITDPKKWEDDYRVGQFVRWTNSTSFSGYTPSNLYIGYGGTQIYLMGDGGSDSFANGIRNEVYPSDQNYTKLQLNGMVSNDIQTVTIVGLS